MQPSWVVKAATRLSRQAIHVALTSTVRQHLAARLQQVIAYVYPARSRLTCPAFQYDLIVDQVGLHPPGQVRIADTRNLYIYRLAQTMGTPQTSAASLGQLFAAVR